MNERVDIVMATYNGMPYIREQLQSILWQDYPQFRLLIHDDGSTDGTVEEIRKIAERYPDKVFFVEDGITFKDAKKNFEHLLKMTDADYIFLTDQDDVWLPSKVSAMLKHIKNGEQQYGGMHKPILVFSDLSPIDKNGFPKSTSMFKMENVNPRAVCLELLLSRNIIPGCVMGFNRSLLEASLPFPNEAIMHDWWLALVAAATGNILYVPKSLVLYRQHERNAIGVRDHTLKSSFFRLARSPMNMLRRFSALGQRAVKQAVALLEHLEGKGLFDKKAEQTVKRYLEYRQGHFLSKIRYFGTFARDGLTYEFARLMLWK